MADKNLKAEVIDTSLTKELKKSYIDYAMSVIVSRAIPDVRDGLKPVHRRILYSMGDMSLYHTRGHKKCARVVGEVLGKYHPHGDTSVYNALVRMAQSFSLRYPLVDGQGNFGSIDGDSPAAMRYTESRLQKISKFMLKDIDKNTVDFRPNFDESLKEPVVLPSQFPNLLVNGSSGIAVGMATSVLPHNMTEVCNALIYMLDQDYDEVKPTDLMEFVSGPDFPTGGKVLGRDGILKAYETGHGKVKVRGVIEKEEKRSKTKLIITEIPYMVKKSDIIKEIAELVKEDKIKGIRDLKDESNRKGIRVVIDLKTKANPDLVINRIFKNTRMEKTLSMIHQVLVDGKPRLLNLKDMIYEFIKHRKVVIKRRTQFLLTKAENRLHIVKGLIIALDSIDDVVNLIKSSDDVESAKESLISKYKLDEKQSESILQMRLQKLTSLEQKTLREEKESLEGEVSELKGILNSEEKIKQIIKDETKEIVDEFGDDRKTEIVEDYKSITRKDLVKKEEIVITLTNKGYIKRVPLKEYRVQGRGGKGVLASNVSDEEFIKNIILTDTHSEILFFSNKGKVYSKKAYEIPKASRTAKGKHIANLLTFSKEESVSHLIDMKKAEEDNKDSLFFITKKGYSKRTEISNFENVRKSGIIAIKLEDDDNLVEVLPVNDDDKVMLSTKHGKSIRFKTSEVRVMGRNTRGVIGIKLASHDEVRSGILANTGEVLTVTSYGYAKRTDIEKYSVIHRGGKGVINVRITPKNGEVVEVLNTDGKGEIMILSKNGKLIRLSVEKISRIGRSTLGVKCMNVDSGDEIISAEKISFIEEE